MNQLGALMLGVAVVACGGGASNGDVSGDGADAAVVDAPDAPPGWEMLVGRSWSVPAGSSDTYKCTRIKMDHDVWISGFRAVAPTGTHHTVVTISSTATPLGDYDCNVGSLDYQMLYASGVNTDELRFPAGVAMQVKAGQYINLNLHLFNATDGEITGTSGILIKTMDAAAVVHPADMVFAGTMDLTIPSDGQPHDVLGGCTTPRDWNVFTLWPHMHQYATHQKVTVTLPGQAQESLLDIPFTFTEQRNYPDVAKAIPKGSRLDVTCTYVNNSGSTISWGDSSTAEMCFTGMYKWPAGGTLFDCSR